MRQILATTGLCTLALLAACSDDSKGTHDAGGDAQDSGSSSDAQAGGAAGGGDGGGAAGRDAAAGGGAAGAGGGASGGAGGAGDGGGVGGAGDGGGDAGGQPAACDPSKAPDVGKLKLETVVSGLDNLVFATQAPGSSDWYLVRQTGQILRHSGSSNTPLLDVSSEIALTSSPIADDERGLLGLAFAPDYATSGVFYVMMTPTVAKSASDDHRNRDVVRQYKWDGNSAMFQATLVELPASAVNHNGGNITFGPDGMLYVGTGDGGGSCNDNQAGAPQDPSKLFGKILRLDPSNTAGNYAAAGNPFQENPLVWQIGLRNPYRYTFDRSTGDLYIGDVGQDSYEEVDFIKSGSKGLNFGWSAYEGNNMTCSGRTLNQSIERTAPIFVADRRKSCSGSFCDWKSVIGGVVYHGSALPQLQGIYLFGDYVGVRMVALRQCDGMTSPFTIVRKQCDPNSPKEACFTGTSFDALTAIVQDSAGELYFVADQTSLLKVVPGP